MSSGGGGGGGACEVAVAVGMKVVAYLLVAWCRGGDDGDGVACRRGGSCGDDAMIGGGVHRLWRPEVLPEMETAAKKLGWEKGGARNLWREECVFR
ncbi:hypothetical protein Tco_0230150, partial [Tanacetum coccineum]